MVIINTISDKYFSLDGIQFAKIYQPLNQGDTAIGLYSVFDTSQQLKNSTEFSEYLINGVSYSTQALTMSAILAVVYSVISVSEFQILEGRVDNLEENQYTGVQVYSTYADEGGGLSFLPVSGTPLVSYKVSNDPTASNNGYHHWGGSAYIKDSDLVVNEIDPSNTYEGVSGQAVSTFSAQHTLISKSSSLTFTNDSGEWKLIAVAGAINAINGTYSLVSLANEIIIDYVGYTYLLLDMQTGVVFTETNWVTAYAYIKARVNYSFIGRVYPDSYLFDMHCDYNINGVENINVGGTDINVDTPVYTDTIVFKDDEELPFYKNSIFKELFSGRKYNVVLETGGQTNFKRIEINNPTRIKASDITGDNTNTRIVFEADFSDRKLVFKNITKIVKASSSGKSGSYNLLTIGDSITQGNASYQTSPLYLIQQRLLAHGVTINGVGTFAIDNPTDTPPGLTGSYYSEGRGFWNYKNFAGRKNTAYGQAMTVNLTDPKTAKFENPFVRVALAGDKATNPDWCFTNANMNPTDGDGVSYSEDSSQPSGIYYIFDFANYLSAHSVTTPDIISIALGTNDWQETGFINIDDEYLSVQIMYEQIRAAMPTVPIMFIPTQSLFPEDQPEWKNEMFELAERIISLFESKNDVNFHFVPIFQNASRFRAYNTLGTETRINTYNSIKTATANNVHILDAVQPQKEYMDVFEASILSII